MTAKLIDGRSLALTTKQGLAAKIQGWRALGLRAPCLAMTLVGSDPASQIYVAAKERACTEVGIKSRCSMLPQDTSQAHLLEHIHALNEDSEVDGILIQLPLPSHIDRWQIISAIAPEKDVDGLTPYNQGLLAWNKAGLYSCTPLGIMALIHSTKVPIVGAFAAVLGRSVLVGAPTSLMLGNAGATVVSLHSRSRDVPSITSQADILVVATGIPNLVQEHWVKPGSVVIDVGIHRINNALAGDVNFASVAKIASHITPVPGGVGPMTIAMLLSNCIKSYEIRTKLLGGV